MSVEVIEVHTSRPYSLDSTTATGTRRYKVRVTGEADPETAINTQIAATAPFFWGGLARQSIRGMPVSAGVYDVDVEYKLEISGAAAQDPSVTPGGSSGPGGGAPSGTPSGPASDEAAVGANMTLEIGGRPPKLLTSLATLSSGALGGGAAPDFKRAINVGQDGKVEGVEVDDPGCVLTLDYTIDYVSWRYVNRLKSLLWATNNADWFTFKRREAAFLGATLRTVKDNRVAASFRFGLRAESTIAAGDLRDDGANKLPQAAVTFRGWDYLWVKYEEEFDAGTKRTVQRPKFYYVEQVLKEADFTQFGLGG